MSAARGGGEGPELQRRSLVKGDAQADAALRQLLQAFAGPLGALPVAEAQACFASAEAHGPPNDALLAHRSTFCLARALEEHARLALMDWDPARHPLEAFLTLSVEEIKAFYARVRKGLGEEQLCRVSGMGTAAALRKVRGLGEEALQGAEAALAWVAAQQADSLQELAKLYLCSPQDADAVLGPWQLGFGGLAHGSVYLPPPPADGEAPEGREDDEAPEPKGEVWIGLERPAGAPASLTWSPATASPHMAEEILLMLDEICSRTQDMANLKLALLDYPQAGVPEAQLFFSKELERRAAEAARERELQEHAEHDQAVAEAEALARAQFEQAKAPKPSVPPAPAPSTQPPSSDQEAAPAPTRQLRQVGGLKIIHSHKLHEQS